MNNLASARHGTSSAYSSGCRCDACRAYQNGRVAANRAARAADPVSHGTRSSYDAGCRCEACKGSRSKAHRREYAETGDAVNARRRARYREQRDQGVAPAEANRLASRRNPTVPGPERHRCGYLPGSPGCLTICGGDS